MSTFTRWVLLAALPIAVLAIDAQAARQTVCTITVNSPDERDVFRRNLPPDEYDFVELVEHGRPDWFAAACRSDVRCDLLLISGHFDGGDEFYSDRLGAREFLPVDQMERASCSASCPGLLSQLKEVYLFGCNTLNAEAMRSASAEIARSLVRSGHSAADAERLSQVLNERHGESNRDRMRRIFSDVPVIYGFSSKAPLGTAAGPLLDRYFQSGAGGEVGTGRASAKLLSLFAPSSMTVGAGVKDSDPDSGFRRDVCHFSDDRLSPAQKLGFVHDLMGREMAEVRMFFDHIEKYTAVLDERERAAPSVASALDAIARDGSARTRYLDFARDADQPAVRARMLDLARRVGWLSPADQRIELIRMIGEELAGDAVSSADVDLVCDLNKDGALGQERHRLHVSPAQANKVPHAAVLACLGSADGHARVLRALTSPNDDEVRIVQTYLRLRPIADAAEFRGLATGIARMNASDAQVRALDTLAQNPLLDRDGLEELTRLFLRAKSVSVQRAVAGVLIRADYRAIATPELVRALRQHRLKSPDGNDLVDVLIRRLQAS